MENWDSDCYNYLTCTYGCEIWGDDRDILRSKPVEERMRFLQDDMADTLETGMTTEKSCELEQCHSYCVRKELASCRESQYRQMCLANNPEPSRCKVDCDSAWRWSAGFPVAMSLLLGVLLHL